MTGSRVAVVTGGLEGIGRSVVRRLAEDGADVAVLARSAGEDDLRADRVPGTDRRLLVRRVDVSQEEEVAAGVDAVVAAFGRLDVLVNNAAIYPFKAIEEFTAAEFSAVLDVNVKGPWLCSRAALPHLRRHRGSIVNITSTSGLFGGATAEGSAYDASKAALTQLTSSLAAEFGPYGVRVNAVAPATVVTDRNRADLVGTEYGRHEQERTPLGRLGEPADIAAAVAFLVGEDARFITGGTLVVDGGVLAVW
jgi:NAD(P)-dependent dehydrogenase (short-subunit alcohol dehydrogenase family)